MYPNYQYVQQYPPQYPQYQAPNHKYKTQLCRHFSQNGVCAMAARCQFAHGQEELRSMTDPIPTNAQMPMQQQMYQQTPYKEQEVTQQQAYAYPQYPNSQQYNHQTQQQQVTQQILVMILANMEQIFPNDQAIITQLRQGQDYAKLGNTTSASEIIKKIINDPQRTKEEKMLYQTIYDNAQTIYNQMIKQQQQ